ncbi:MAG: MerR family transcriptional regulator [Burkholderiaceae bacterium]|nr:MerR family transcriptional regulator [Burkholderiaceae bacterium]
MPTTNMYPTQSYRIGAVSQTTGIPVSTLRIWEKRYQAFSPIKSPGNHRIFNESDISKALLLKQLSQQGHAISSIAGMNVDQLRRISNQSIHPKALLQKNNRDENTVTFVAVVGQSMANRIESKQFKRLIQDNPLKVSHVFQNIEDTLSIDIPSQPSVLLVKVNSLQPQIQNTLQELKKKHVFEQTIVVYNFATEAMVQALKWAGIVVRREPISDTELADLLQSVLFVDPTRAQEFGTDSSVITARKFSENTLSRVASISTNVLCECPRHVAELISQLASFEEYSQECLNKSPEDAHLHSYLQSISGSARCLFENALEKIATHEGIDLSERSA